MLAPGMSEREEAVPKPHDRGGWPIDEPIDRSEHPVMDWERRSQVLLGVLLEKGLVRVDEVRRAMESLDRETYESLGYYERWTAGLVTVLIEKSILDPAEIDRKTAELEQREG